MVVLYQALALDAYFTKRKKSEFCLLSTLFWSSKKKWSWILSVFKPFLYFIFNKLYFLDKNILFIIFILPHKRKYRISIIDTRHFRIQTLVSLYRTENSSRLSRVFLIRCPWDSNPRTEVLQTCTIDHSVRAPYITLSLVYKNSKKNQVKDYCDLLPPIHI